ncbi:MAG: murein biosynthesis integral membrane protein MurJ [Candidatus Omnitrophica bacterium]|nr:murein biosynthesis integral membrane protein MurJ [Candidatus Omnitrophota bacterium]
MFKKIIKNTSIVSAAVFISRVLGLIRDVLIAQFFGTSALLEAFLVAFRLPNLFRSVFAEGFSDSVATPVLSEYANDRKRLFLLNNHLLSIFSIILIVFSIFGVIFSKYLVALIAPGFLGDAYKFQAAVFFTKVTFFYLFLIGISSICVSTLYVLKKFFAASIIPAFLNVSFIIGILVFNKYLHNYILVICVIVAGIIQVMVSFLVLRQAGLKFSFNLKQALADKVIARMFKLFIPRVWASIVYHLSVFIDTIFSSLSAIVGTGALAAVYYANRFILLPVALIAIPISRVAVVDLSFYHKNNNMEEFKKLFVFSFQNIVFFVVPITVFFIFMHQAVIDVVYRRGAFDLSSFMMTSSVLLFYSLGLFFFCAIKLMVNSFYAMKNTVIPAKTATAALIVNVILSAILMYPLKIGGVALGSSIAAGLNFLLLYRLFIREVGVIDWQDTGCQFLKILFLSLIASLFSRLAWDNLVFCRYIKMSLILVFYVMIIVAGGYLFHLKQVRYINKWLRLRFRN